MTSTPRDRDPSNMASIAANNAFESGLRRDANVTAEDEEMARRILSRAAWLQHPAPVPAPVAARSRRPTWLPLVAAMVVLLATGFATARVIDWIVELRDDNLSLFVKPEASPPKGAAPHATPQMIFEAPHPDFVPTEAPPKAHATNHQSASELFRAAGAARAARRTKEAAQLYLRLARLYPHSAEAELSHVSLGRLWLDDGKAGKALAAFDAYLRLPDASPMEHEALAGRALALQALGKPTLELEAWKALLQKHPDTLLKSRAMVRIHALENAKEP
ncbi:MAG: hypothetical protein SF187_05705 [Deltaproteobacteria bacterium]|nr:hypothetical protein [Deltaproteobacteria bacterium]